MSGTHNYHINQVTQRPNICTAQPGNCPLTTEDGEPMPHFDNKESARQWVAQTEKEKAEQGGNPLGTLTRSKKKRAVEAKDITTARVGTKMSPQVRKLRDAVKDNTKKVVESRSQNSTIALEGANPERAQRRLQESIEYAKSRQNVHLMEKLSTSVVLPSGSFKREDGSRFSTDDLLKNRQAMRNVDDERERLQRTLAKVASDPSLAGQKFTVKNDNGTFTATVTRNNFSEREFGKLSPEKQAAIMKESSEIDIDKAREMLSPATMARVTTKTQVIDYVNGKQYPQDKVSAPTEFTGTPQEQMQAGTEAFAKLYGDTKESMGSSYKAMKAENASMADSIKAVSNQAYEETGRNTFIPARSQYNGAIVSGRENISRAELKKVLSDERIAEISTVKQVPDRDKAKEVLSEREFGRIFGNPGVTLRATEK